LKFLQRKGYHPQDKVIHTIYWKGQHQDHHIMELQGLIFLSRWEDDKYL